MGKKIKKTLAAKLLIVESGKKTFILVKICGGWRKIIWFWYFFIYYYYFLFFRNNFLKRLVFWVHVESCKHTHCSPKTCFVISIKISGEDSRKRSLEGYSFNSFGDTIYFHVLGNLEQTVLSLRNPKFISEKLFGFRGLLG